MGQMSDLFRLDHRVALVTGAARGIGAEIAKTLSSLGATVVVADRDKSVEAIADKIRADGGKADWLQLDVADSGQVEKASNAIVQKHGRTDILVANAGICSEIAALDYSDEEWRRVLAVNLDGVFFCVRAFGRHMAAAKSGAIVAIASICAVKSVRPEVHVGYDVSKAGVAHLCRMLGVEWAKYNIRVNAVGPGYTRTEMLSAVGKTNPDIIATWLDDVPMRRLIEPREIAAAVAFLASDAASSITGQLLMADGGCSVA